MHRLLFKILISITLLSFALPFFSLAQGTPNNFVSTDPNYNPYQSGYVPLAPIQGYTDSSSNTDLSSYLRNMFRLGVALATGLAVIMIVIGGVQYLSTDSVSEKSNGKETIKAALWGLILALASYMILNTINPALLNTNLTFQNTSTNPTSQVLTSLGINDQDATILDTQVTPAGTYYTLSNGDHKILFPDGSYDYYDANWNWRSGGHI